jgi:hypothetical protein
LDRESAYAVPKLEIDRILGALNRTPDRHWHIFLEENDAGEVELSIPDGSRLALKDFEFKPSSDDRELSETRVMQRNYWGALTKVLNVVGGPVAGNKKPQPQSWMSYPTGRSGFHLNAAMVRPKNQIRAELYISGKHAKTFFTLLKRQKDAVERELGYPLEWEELPLARDCRIASYLNDVDPEKEADWPQQHDWLSKRLNDLHRVFAQRVRALDADAEQVV